MSSLHQSVDAITFIFGAAFKAKLDGRDAARTKREADERLRPLLRLRLSRDGRRGTRSASATNWGLDREDAAGPGRTTRLTRPGCFRGGLAAGRREWNRRLEIMCGEADYADFSNRITDRDIPPPPLPPPRRRPSPSSPPPIPASRPPGPPGLSRRFW